MVYVPRVDLSLLSCPVTSRPLRIKKKGDKVFLEDEFSEYSYTFRLGVPSLIPEEVPEDLKSHWSIWEQLQANGLISYESLPSLNTSLNIKEAEAALEVFDLSGLVLDVGCGPNKVRPAYVRHVTQENYYGLDPLMSNIDRDFRFVHGIAEKLPFIDGCFDSLVFYSCLDHMLDLDLALTEASRVLKLNGTINIRMDIMPKEESSFARAMNIVNRGIRQFFAAKKELGLAKGFLYVRKIASLKIPKGAKDMFHYDFPNFLDIINTLEEQKFGKLKTKKIGSEIAISMTKLDQN